MEVEKGVRAKFAERPGVSFQFVPSHCVKAKGSHLLENHVLKCTK